MIIEIEGIKKADELALEDLLALWVELGAIGSSRWTAFYADGDGEFRPKIKVNGEAPKRYTKGSHPKEKWHNVYFKLSDDDYSPESMYLLDSDLIAANERENG